MAEIKSDDLDDQHLGKPVVGPTDTTGKLDDQHLGKPVVGFKITTQAPTTTAPTTLAPTTLLITTLAPTTPIPSMAILLGGKLVNNSILFGRLVQ